MGHNDFAVVLRRPTSEMDLDQAEVIRDHLHQAEAEAFAAALRDINPNVEICVMGSKAPLPPPPPPPKKNAKAEQLPSSPG